jgi:propionyl-CoA synthetase
MPAYGYNVKLFDEATGEEITAPRKGVVAIEGPLPPVRRPYGAMTALCQNLLTTIPNRHVYSTFDWGIRDEDGYFFILGRTDDVINVAGHRLGTREIEESLSSHSNVAEVAVVGVADALKGQVAMAFVILKDPSLADTPAKKLAHEGEMMKTVDSQLGAVARPSRVHFVSVLPKTRSGKLLRRSIQALCEGRDPGDLTTIEDPTALEQIRSAVRT